MKQRRHKETLVLGLTPTSRGLGFALLEGPHRLVDWGVKKSAQTNKNAHCLAKAKELIEHYRPDVIVLEDCKGSRRGARVQQLIRDIVKQAKRMKVRTRCFTRTKVQQAFPNAANMTKHEIAFVIVEQLPELAPQFPTRRQPWMTEDYRMTIFDAVGLALTWFHLKNRRKRNDLSSQGT